MRNLKTYEGFFDLFKNKLSEDDKIVSEYISRLKKVKGISPYNINFNSTHNDENYMIYGETSHRVDKYNVDFEDTPIKLWSVISLKPLGFDKQSQDFLISKNFVKYSNKEFFGLNIICEGEPENCKPKSKILKELVDLVKLVYENDKEARRIAKIKFNINKAADLIDDVE
jgi:hypothetical protein